MGIRAISPRTRDDEEMIWNKTESFAGHLVLFVISGSVFSQLARACECSDSLPRFCDQDLNQHRAYVR